MRKAILIFFVVLGMSGGMLVVLDETITLKLLFAGIGAVVGVAIGGAIATIGRHRHRRTHRSDIDYGRAAVGEEQSRNYWLDRGRLTAAPGMPLPDDSDAHSREP